MTTSYFGYPELTQRYNRDRRTLWRWWAKDKILPAPTRINGIFLGWTEQQLAEFEGDAKS